MKRLFLLLVALAAISTVQAMSDYNQLGTTLNRPFKVKGGSGVLQFAKAISGIIGFDAEEAEVDTKNGFISQFSEGDGRYKTNMCVWKREDGKKMFVVSYTINETHPITPAGPCSPCHYSKIEKIEDFEILVNTGFRAYLFNEKTSTLEPMPSFPVNVMPAEITEGAFLELPQHGKDIYFVRDGVVYVLKWNGLNFNYVGPRGVGVYIIDPTSPTNVRNAPGGDIVATLDDGDMISVDRCVKGWFHISGNDYQKGDGNDGTLKYTGDKWVHGSVIHAGWNGGATVTLREEPRDDALVLFETEGNDTDEAIQIKVFLDMHGKWAKVRLNNGKEGWIETENLCGNSLTNCC